MKFKSYNQLRTADIWLKYNIYLYFLVCYWFFLER